MYQQVLSHCSRLSLFQVLAFGVVLAVGIELCTIWARFGIGLQSTRDTTLIGTLTFGVRIHHGYIGILLIVLACGTVSDAGLRNFVLMIGIALFVSDVVHHFLVLWATIGSPEFDLLYPSNKDGRT